MRTRVLAAGSIVLLLFNVGAVSPSVALASATVVLPQHHESLDGVTGNAIAFRSSSAGTTVASSSVAVAKPTGVVSGDVLMAAVSVRGLPTITPPSGWSQVRSDVNGTVMTQATFSHLAGGSEPASYTFTFSTSVSAAAVGILAYSGVDPVNPVDVSAGQANASSTSITAPTMTVHVADTYLIGVFGIGNDPTFTPPAGTTERFGFTVVGDYKIGLEVTDEARLNAGASGTRVATTSKSAANLGQLVALRPIPSVAYRSSANATGTATTTLAITKPAGVSSGDVLIAAISTRGAPTITAPSGWALVRSDVNGTTQKQALYSHPAGGSEPASYSWSFSTSVTAVVGEIEAYSGADPVNPIDVAGGQVNTTSSTSITASSVTTLTADTYLVGAFGIANSETSITAPSGMTHRQFGTASGTSKVSLELGDVAMPSPAASGSKVATAVSSAAASIGQLVAIRPLPYIAFRSSSTGSGSSTTSVVVNKPAGVVSGDGMVAVITPRGLPTITPPAGWSLIRSDVNTTVLTQALYVHVAGGSEPASYTWTFNSSVSSVVAGIAAYSGIDPTNPIDTSGGQANASSSSITAPSINPTVTDTYLVGAFGDGNAPAPTGWTVPASMTDRFHLTVSSPSMVGVEFADEAHPTTAATGTRVVTTPASAANIGQLVALRPHGAVPSNNAPTVGPGTVRTTTATALTVTLGASDPETCELTFSTLTGPAHGALSAITNQACVTGSPNTDSATVVYTPTAGYTGQDSFTYKANDGSLDGAAATVGITVQDPLTNLGRQGQSSFEGWSLGSGDDLSVNVGTGNAVLSHSIVSLPIRGSSLSVGLVYNSQDATNVGIGPGFRLNLQRRLTINADSTVTFADADGARYTFTNPVTVGSVTTYSRPAALFATLVKDTSQAHPFALTYRDLAVDRFDVSGSSGLLVRSEDRHANGVTIAYSSGTDIGTVTDDTGRQLVFTWNTGSSPHQLSSFTDWAWIDGAGVVQTTATGSHRSYRFFYDGSGNLAGWADPLSTAGSCPANASHLTCLTYVGGFVTAITKTQTLEGLSGSNLTTSTRTITTDLAYNGSGISSVTDAEQHAQGSPKRTIFTSLAGNQVRVVRPTTTTTYSLAAVDDPYARVGSVFRAFNASTAFETRTVWDSTYPTLPATVTANYGALYGTPARTITFTYAAASLGLVQKLVEPLTASTNRWTEYVYNANNDATQKTVSLDGSGTSRTITRFCYDAGCTTSGSGLDLLGQIDNYVAAGPQNADTNVTTNFVSDSYGERTSTTRHNRDAAGAVRDDRVDTAAYDASGNATSTITNYANGTVTSPGDDITPNATTGARTDLTTTMTFDTAGNQVSTADPRRAILAATGSPAVDDYVTRQTFDALNEPVTTTTPTTPGITITQQTNSSAYDELGAVRSATDYSGLVSATAFDRAGRAITTYEVPVGSSTAATTSLMTYDPDGRTLTAKDRRQVADSSLGSTSYQYDDLGHQVAFIEGTGSADEAETDSAFDALDRHKSQTTGVATPASQKTKYSLDLGGRVTSTDDTFTCASTTYDYRDLATQTIEGQSSGACTGAGTRTITSTIDGLGRTTLRAVTAGTGVGDQPESTTFDAVGDTLIRSGTQGGTTTTSTFTVNLHDQPLTEARTDGSTSKSTFDAAGNGTDRCYWKPAITVGACLPADTASWTNPPTQAGTTGYDARNQKISLISRLGSTSTAATTLYDATHNYQISAFYLPTVSGKEAQDLYGYDARNRLTTITHQLCTVSTGHACSATTSTGSTTYAYDDNDNRTTVTESSTGGGATTRTYCYDALNRLTSSKATTACTSSPDETFLYDDAGNRTSTTVSASTRTFTYGTNGQLNACANPTCTISYDPAGRTATLTDNGVSWTFAYDADGRVISACKSTACTGSIDRVDYLYDGSGHRTQIKETTSGGTVTTTDLRYQGGTIVQELVGGTVTRTYATDDSGRIVEVCDPDCSSGTIYVVVYNGHGDATGLWRQNTDGTLTLANSYTYSTWGTPTTTVNTGGGFSDLKFRFLYVGSSDVQWDSSFGLNLSYMHARHYSPALGRFIQPDPSGAEANLYGYTQGNPVTRADSSGGCWQLLALEEFGPIAWGATALCVGGVGLMTFFGARMVVQMYHWCGNGRCNINWHPAGRSISSNLSNPLRGCVIGRWSYCPGILLTRDNQVPSWVPRNIRVLPGESGKDIARRLLDERYGPGNWRGGPDSEENKIKKWIDRKVMNR